jgi:hypothetical protein
LKVISFSPRIPEAGREQFFSESILMVSLFAITPMTHRQEITNKGRRRIGKYRTKG